MGKTERTFHVRLGKVRPKPGTMKVVSLDQRRALEHQITVNRRIQAILQGYPTIAGYAFVIWAPDNSSSGEYFNFGPGGISKASIPDFVRNRLLLEVGLEWGRLEFQPLPQKRD